MMAPLSEIGLTNVRAGFRNAGNGRSGKPGRA
jgi:hypothetical protein